MDHIDVIRSWAPTALCAFNVGLAIYYAGTSNGTIWQTVIIGLPMCFFFASVSLFALTQKVRDLQKEVEMLRLASGQRADRD
ncbi:MAG TPA: hypothetical protein VFG49_08450 [Dyella sp.]|uniref:hypothetical protein n=1 Tax=Dyella sp. TaxID=1869338 RepID=UPI002D799E87|nr:hypothetical protein [Dyella sp.]HET6553553.1 hypothetical protein [Dyella sp.]